MESGFLTPNGNIEVARKDILAFSKDYCKSIKSVELEKFRQNYKYLNGDYEFLLRILKWIQVGSVSFGENSCIIDNRDSLGVYECKSDNYFGVKKKEARKLLSIEYINTLKFHNQKDTFVLENGFILRDGTLVTSKDEQHIKVCNALLNYYSINSELVNEVLKKYDISCFEDLLISLFGFLKVGSYVEIKAVEYSKKLSNACLDELVFIYERMGFKIFEYEPIDKDLSRDLLLSLRM